MTKDIKYKLEKLSLKPGDIVVIKCDFNKYTPDQIHDMQEDFRETLPKDTKGIILHENLKLNTISDEQLKELGLQRIKDA